MPTNTVSLMFVELNNWDLGAFLFTSAQPQESSPKTTLFRFSLVHDAVEYGIHLGFLEEGNRLHGFTQLDFASSFEADLALLKMEIHPRIVSGEGASSIRPGGDIERVLYEQDLDSARALLYSRTDSELLDYQDAQKKVLRGIVEGLLPAASEVINRVREAVRLELYSAATELDITIQTLRAMQQYRGWEEIEYRLDLGEAAFLFAAFPRRGLARLPQETELRFKIVDPQGREYASSIPATRSGLSPDTLGSSAPTIQTRLDTGTSPSEASLLDSIESLYADNFTMAVFHAATVYELSLEDLFNRITAQGNTDAMALKDAIRPYRKAHRVGRVAALSYLTLPSVLSSDQLHSGLIARCISAWDFRSKVVAHLSTPRAGEGITRHQAWSLVTAILEVIRTIS